VVRPNPQAATGPQTRERRQPLEQDEAAFSAALIAASEAALRVVRSVGLSATDAADVLQEPSSRAWRHRDQRRGDFRAWFVTIAYREARRPHRRWPTTPSFWKATAEDPADDSLSDVMVASLESVPKRQRTALSLRYDAGLSTKEVAQAMSISEPAAKQLLARARESLRLALARAPMEGV
jgi:RNA polymerase sigma-70 factor, ECF subfamily